MITQVDTTVRPAHPQDRQLLASLIHFESYVHRHLDWRAALDWLGDRPYLVAERGSKIVAALACPPDPPQVAWIRVFAVSDTVSPDYAWRLLWPTAWEELANRPGTHVAAIPMQDWFRKLLVKSEFVHTYNVILLAWERRDLPPERSVPDVRIRPMLPEDLPQVTVVDTAAFKTIWRNSMTSLHLAYRQAMVATVAEGESGIIGYQISTHNPMGGHLARLAVHPLAQRRGIGYMLIRDMLDSFQQRGVHRVTVNTQDDNQRSLSLYQKIGFARTGEEYPIYQYNRR